MRIQYRILRPLAAVGVAIALVLALAGPASAGVTFKTFRVRPHSGPPGTTVRVRGTGLKSTLSPCSIDPWAVSFSDASRTSLYPVTPNDMGSFHLKVTVPLSDAPGPGSFSLVGTFEAKGSCQSTLLAVRRFTVTPAAATSRMISRR